MPEQNNSLYYQSLTPQDWLKDNLNDSVDQMRHKVGDFPEINDFPERHASAPTSNTIYVTGPMQDPMAGVNGDIRETCYALEDLLQYKNRKYGNSALEPIKVFSKSDAETGLLQRMDDKIARIQNSSELRKNDVADLFGYIALLCVTKGWTNFDEFKD